MTVYWCLVDVSEFNTSTKWPINVSGTTNDGIVRSAVDNMPVSTLPVNVYFNILSAFTFSSTSPLEYSTSYVLPPLVGDRRCRTILPTRKEGG
jgi:hypothetical protein